MEDFKALLQLVQEVWTEGVYGIDVGHSLLALLIFSVFMILRDVMTRFLIARVRGLAARTTSTLDDALIDAVQPPVRFIPVVMGIFFATSALDLSAELQSFANNVNRSLVTFCVFWLLHQSMIPIGALLNEASHVLTSAMIDWLSKFLRLAVILLGVATVLEIWGIEVGPIIAGLGLFGVAVALGAQDLFKNLIAGLFVIGERRFLPGDWILVAGCAEGIVENIGFRTTTIRQFDKAPIYVPNAELADHAVVNFSRMTYRRIKWVIGLRYDTSGDQLRAIRQKIEDYIFSSDDFVQPEQTATFIRIDAFGASSIDLQLYCFTKTTDWLKWLEIKETLLLFIKDCVAEEGSDFAFPSQSLYVEALPLDSERIGGTAVT